MSSRSRTLVLAAVALVLAACAGPAPRKANDVRVMIAADPPALSLIGKPDFVSSQIAAVISDGLVAYDAQMRYVPMVAKSWEIAPDGMSVTFHLREGVLWHDGEPVTSRDVAFTARKIQDPATQSQSWASAFADITAIETPDDRTIVVRYAHPYADVLDGWRVPLIPEHAAAKDADFLGGAFAQHPVGCGPFRFESHEAGRSVALLAFDRYWGGRPKIDRIIFKVFTAERTGYEALLMRDIDLVNVSPDLWREAATSSNAARLAKLVYYRLSAWRLDWSQDGDTPFFKDKRVRRALLYALDRKRFAETAGGGLARPGVSAYPPECPWADPSITALPYDPKEAARLLDEAGWRSPAPGRLREKDGVPFSFTLLFNASTQEIADRMAAWIQQSLKDVNVDVKLEKLTWEAFKERRKTHRFQAAVGTVVFDATPDRFDLYHSSAREGGYNYGGFADSEVDRLLEEGRATLDPDARRVIYNRLQRRLDDLQPIAILFQMAQPLLHDADLLGLQPTPMGIYQYAPGPRAWQWAGSRVGS